MAPKGQQQEIKDSNPARINLMVEVLTGGAKKKTELPLRLLVMGDFTGRENSTPVAEREAVNINKDNFDGVMDSLGIKTKFNVPTGGGDETEVNLKFSSVSDFHPERVARQLPHITKLVTARKLLQELRNRVINLAEFRKGLQSIVLDPAALEQLIAELDRVVPGESSATARVTDTSTASPP